MDKPARVDSTVMEGPAWAQRAHLRLLKKPRQIIKSKRRSHLQKVLPPG
jgi:hypothetical protein